MDSLCIFSKLYDQEIDSIDIGSFHSNVNLSHRSAVLKWLFESLELLKVGDKVFFGTVLLADKFCSICQTKRILEGSELQLVILAALCCTLKAVDSSIELSVKAFLEHVSGGHVDPRDIFATEAKILQSTDFNAFTPALSVYIESFYYAFTLPSETGKANPLEQRYPSNDVPEWALKQQQLALFLLFISVFNMQRLHSRRASELVSACIITSALTLVNVADAAGPSLDDVVSALVRCGWINKASDVAILVAEVTSFWKQSLVEPSDAIRSVIAAFDSPERRRVSRINPKQTAVFSPDEGISVSGG